MTNEPIKPGYYWAKDNRIIYATDSCISYADTGEMVALDAIQIIAPALPPDQWPTKETVHKLVKARPYNGTDFAFVEGFMACYKLFTGKDLQ